MYEDQTFENIMERLLDRVPNNYDKREGSLIYNALAPAAAEIAQMYIELSLNENLTFADTATGEYLSRRTAEYGVNREPATRSIRQGEFWGRSNEPMDIPIGSRFSIDAVNFVAIERITAGVYQMQCEQLGTIGNTVFGNLLPIQNINGLARAELTDILIPGEEEETDESLRQRFYDEMNEPPFSGNIAQYKQLINGFDGVGATKVFPVWQGGGTVKCTIIAADWLSPSPTLVDTVQNNIDPLQYQGQGIGLAPIDHKVTIAPVSEVTINVQTNLTLEGDLSVVSVQSDVEQAIENYLLGLRRSWADQEQIVVRVALIESAILSVSGVIDISGTQINGGTGNVTLGQEEIPTLGTVTIN